jgi:flagellar hook protein FlgE
MDVIGNNIANVNTFGYKTNRATFSDVYYQTINAGRATSDTRGGQNPTQVGYGSQLATIDVIMSNGGGSYTGRAQDVYIDGDGFLTVKDADGAYHYTRLGNLAIIGGKLVDYAGNFVMGIPFGEAEALLDDDGNPVVDGDGNPVTVGPYSTFSVADPGNGDFWNADQLVEITFYDALVDDGNGGTTPKSILDCVTSVSIGSDGSIYGVTTQQVTYPAEGDPQETIEQNEIIYLGHLALATFANQDGMSQVGMSQYDPSASSGDPQYTTADTNGAGKTQAGYLEMANVELSQQFTDMITTQRGFQANSRIITVSDEMLQELVNLKR